MNLGIDSKLNAAVKRYKPDLANNLPRLLKKLLCGHFGMDINTNVNNLALQRT
jgi:hypothetical protein